MSETEILSRILEVIEYLGLSSIMQAMILISLALGIVAKLFGGSRD